MAKATTKKSHRITRTVISRSFASGRNAEILKGLQEDSTSQQVVDPFDGQYGVTESLTNRAEYLSIIHPPHNPSALRKIPTQNNILLQCISAMVTNCHLFGHTFEYVAKEGKPTDPAAEEERRDLEELISQPNGKDSIRSIRSKAGWDYETFGYAFFEVGRDASQDIAWFDHVPAETMRLCRTESTSVQVTRKVYRRGEEIEVEFEQHFRRFVQQVGARRIYFKEFGDPRDIDKATGMVMAKDGDPKNLATEVIHYGQNLTSDPYGQPKWVNNVPAALGSRESELCNLNFFKDNAIPAMAILVSGGELTEDSMDEIDRQFNGTKGQDSVHRVLILEAKGDEDAVGSTDAAPPIPQLSIQPLTGERQSDSLFAEYDKANQEKIQSSFRLTPIYLGKSNDYTRATAEAAVDVTENQVFGPERQAFDDIFNTRLLLRDGMPPKYWKFTTNGVKLTNSETIMEALTLLDSMGAVTPNIAINLCNQYMGLNLKPVEGGWGDLPFQVVLAKFNGGQTTPEIQDGVDAMEETVKKNLATVVDPNMAEAAPEATIPDDISDSDLSALEAMLSNIDGSEGSMGAVKKALRQVRSPKIKKTLRKVRRAVSQKLVFH